MCVLVLDASRGKKDADKDVLKTKLLSRPQLEDGRFLVEGFPLHLDGIGSTVRSLRDLSVQYHVYSWSM